MKIASICSLEDAAYKMDGPIRVNVPAEEGYIFREGTFDPSEDLEEADRIYREMDNVIAFIDGGILYAVPACGKVRKILMKEGFKLDWFLRVPFTFGSYPVEGTQHWNNLLNWQNKRIVKERYEENDKLRQRNRRLNFSGR